MGPDPARVVICFYSIPLYYILFYYILFTREWQRCCCALEGTSIYHRHDFFWHDVRREKLRRRCDPIQCFNSIIWRAGLRSGKKFSSRVLYSLAFSQSSLACCFGNPRLTECCGTTECCGITLWAASPQEMGKFYVHATSPSARV